MEKLILLFFLSSHSLMAIEPMEYAKKPEIKTSTQVVGDKIYFSFGFRDLKGNYQEWDWNDDFQKLLGSAGQFGLPVKSDNSRSYYDEELPSAMYKNHPGIGVIPDYSALVSFYYDSVTPLYNHWKKFVARDNLDQRQSLDLLLRFFQDYPYGVPPQVIDNKLVNGLFVPPLSLQNGWADCDSKSLWMATVLSHDPAFKNKLAMIMVPGHAFLGIEIWPQVYDEKYTYRNRTFIVAEPTGLSRTPLGRKNSPYSTLIGIEPISISETYESSSAPTLSAGEEVRELTEKDCPDNGLLIDYVSAVEGGRVQVCQIKVDGNYLKHGPEVKYNAQGQAVSSSVYDKGVKI
jgi:hypothetical protein